MHTKALKSKDVDVIVGFDTLEKLGKEFMLKKNVKLKRYEIVVEGVSVDIYVPYFSKLAIPAEELNKFVVVKEGIKTLIPEALVVLKQQAEMERSKSLKGLKDRLTYLTS